MRPTTLTELCKRHEIEEPPSTRGIKFDGFAKFLQVYTAACECIRSREELQRLIVEVAEDAREQGVCWLEVAFDADRYSEAREGQEHQLFATQEENWEFALRAAEKAERATGVGSGVTCRQSGQTPLTFSTPVSQHPRIKTTYGKSGRR